jgi:ADP-dependent phosphofructokinase/glucokinase
VDLVADKNLWQQRLKTAVSRTLSVRTFAAFNTNIDSVVHLTPENIARAIAMSGIQPADMGECTCEQLPNAISTPQEFLTVVKTQLAAGKSCYTVIEGNLLSWINAVFTEAKQRMGGQAGIIANQMAALGATSIAYTRLLTQQQAMMFDPRVLVPAVVNDALQLKLVGEAARPNDNVKVNWIFEYAKGAQFQFGDQMVTTPRANRIITATRPKGAIMAFEPALDAKLAELGEQCDTAFMAGYHYATPTNNGDLDFPSYLAYTKHSLAELRRNNPNLLIHYEYVPVKHESLEAELLRGIGEMSNSFGINENEIKRALRTLGYEELAATIDQDEQAFTLYQGGLALLHELQVDRVHVHNLGYYVIIIRKPYCISVDDVVGASLYASAVNAMKAKYGNTPSTELLPEAAEMMLSDIGYTQVDLFAEHAKKSGLQIAEGMWDFADHYVLVVPAHVVPNPVSTVGMGDTISSSSYAMETVAAKATISAIDR